MLYKLVQCSVVHRPSLSFWEDLQPFKLRNYSKTNNIKFVPVYYNHITKDLFRKCWASQALHGASEPASWRPQVYKTLTWTHSALKPPATGQKLYGYIKVRTVANQNDGRVFLHRSYKCYPVAVAFCVTCYMARSPSSHLSAAWVFCIILGTASYHI